MIQDKDDPGVMVQLGQSRLFPNPLQFLIILAFGAM
jgi:hypothetical protein